MAKTEALQGIAASSGLAIGPALILPTADQDVPRRAIAPQDVAAEHARLDVAIAAARVELTELIVQVDALHEDATQRILEVQLMLLDDPEVRAQSRQAIADELLNAEYAYHRVFARASSAYESSGTEVFRDRAVDFRDVSRRVLRHLTGGLPSRLATLDAPCVVVAHDLEPSETIHFHKGKVLAVLTDEGGRTSHSALLARSHGIPAVVGLRNVTRQVQDGDLVAVDGYSGAVWPRPSANRADRFRRRIRVLAAHGKELEALRDLPATTPDGRTVELSANLEIPEEVDHVLESGASGIGLYRTEFFYLGRPHLPTEEEQIAAYRGVAERMHPRPVIIRTMDLGGDKVASYMRTDDEANPFLGWRGIRFALHHPEVFRTQLRAIFRASAVGNVKVMFPMVTTYDELDQALALCDEVKLELTAEKHAVRPRLRDRHDGRDAVGRVVGRPHGEARGVLLHRLERPHPVHAGDGPRQREDRLSLRAARSGRAALDPRHRRGRARRGSLGRPVRRDGRRSADRGPAPGHGRGRVLGLAVRPAAHQGRDPHASPRARARAGRERAATAHRDGDPPHARTRARAAPARGAARRGRCRTRR